jgi:hypothetical protein
MIRRVLESARGVIVHSRFMVDEQMRAAGFRRTHRADSPRRVDSAGRPQRLALPLGLDESPPLIGIFGFLKALQAHRRIVARLSPAAARDAGGQDDSGG